MFCHCDAVHECEKKKGEKMVNITALVQNEPCGRNPMPAWTCKYVERKFIKRIMQTHLMH